MGWDWEEQQLLEQWRGLVAAGATTSDVLEALDDHIWPLPRAARALQDLFGLEPTAAELVVARHPAYVSVAVRNAAIRGLLRTASSEAERVRVLLRASEGSPEYVQPGASDEVIDAFAERTGIGVPGELRALLQMSNGSLGGYGGFFGIRPQPPVRDIEHELRPHFPTRGWLPFAADGCGSIYVLALHDVTSCGPAVLFLDWEHSRGELFNVASYVMASGVWPFLRLQLMQDLDLLDWHWPFDRLRTLEEDPALLECTSAPLPWNT